MIAPNKQNLILLKGQLKLIQNGHKLLKEKRAGLISHFLEFARRGKLIEQSLFKEFSVVLNTYEKSLTFVSVESLFKNLPAIPAMLFKSVRKRLSGVYIQNFSIKIEAPARENIKIDIQNSLTDFSYLFPLMLELVQLKINTKFLAEEILKTNRQIANLEEKTLNTQADIKFIQTALNEKENFEKATLIKIFQ